MEIYVHIPFCVRKCAYCDFYSLPDARSMEEEYFKALKEEITEWGLKCRETGRTDVSSVFFGGGTPSCADPRHISETMALLRRYFSLREDAEITLEANPGTLDKKKLETYKQAGINRLSLGLQSADDVMLEKLGRIHRFRDFEKSYYLARETGFRNISVDLMSGLPGETETGFINSLKTVLSFEPEHLSVYSLIIAENTPFYALYGPEGTKTEELPGEDTDRRIVSRTREILEASGYRQYEISNYAKPGFASRHNIGYWTGEEYLGFGAAAASFLYTKIGNAGRRSPVTETGSTVEAKTKVDTSPGFGSVPRTEAHNGEEENLPRTGVLTGSNFPPGTMAVRFKNAEDLQYRQLSRTEEEFLTREDLMAEFMILGLRMKQGVSPDEFEARFGVSMEERYGHIIRKYIDFNVLRQDGERISLTPFGEDVCNILFEEFL